MFNNEKTKVNEIHFNTKYVSGDALKVFTDFSKNTYIIKGSTGIGGTTALLNYTKNHCLIISPNVGMIKSKERSRGNYESDKQFFIHSKGEDKWNSVSDYLTIYDNCIINTTPNQILKLRNENKKLYNSIINIPVFVDEIHAFSVDSDYRSEVGQFLELLYNEWLAPFKLSTATPNYNFLDVPTDKKVKYYKLIRENEPKKKIQVSNKLKDAKQFIQSEHLKGRMVICFTNNINYHKSFTNLKVRNLIGQTLDIKLKPFERGLALDNELYNDTDVIFLSSSYLAGYDIQKDCSVCIISEQSNEAYKININNVTQAYGRCRAKVHNALFVNATSPITKGKAGIVNNHPITLNEVCKSISKYQDEVEYYQTKTKDITWYSEVKEYPQITPHLYVNRAVVLAPILNYVYDYQLYNETVMYEALEGYGFVVSEYINKHDNLIVKEVKTQFKTRLKNLLKVDEIKLLHSYYDIKKNLKFKSEGNFTVQLAIDYLTAFLLKRCDAKQIIKKLDNKRVKPNEFFRSMDAFLRANVDTTYYYNQLNLNLKLYKDERVIEALNDWKCLTDDWQMLYACYKVTHNILTPKIEREITLYELFYDANLCIKYNVDKNRVRNTKRVILKRCKTLTIDLNSDELIWLEEVVKSIYKTLDEGKEYVYNINRKTIKKKMINALIYLLTDGQIKKFEDVKNREYNPLTQLPTNMRCIIPIKYVSVDLTSANPQIVDSILNIKKGLTVYQSLMYKLGLTRNKAKKLYNSTLNNHRLSVNKAKSIYIDSGYGNSKALELAKLTAGVIKGAFYEVMTMNEKRLMNNYSSILPIKSYRFHDAIIIKNEDIDLYNITLPTMVKDYKYHVEQFNDSSNYNGNTTENENNGKMVENMYLL